MWLKESYSGEDEIGIAPKLLNFSYKLFVRKHAFGHKSSNFHVIDVFGLVGDEDMLNVTLMFATLKSHIFKLKGFCVFIFDDHMIRFSN